MTKKIFTVYGNCQAPAVAEVLQSSDEFKKKYKYIKIKPVQELTHNDIKELSENILPKLDLLIYQPVSKNYKGSDIFSSESIIKRIPRNSIRISFQSLYFNGYYPELMTLKDENNKNISINFYKNGKHLNFLVHDINILKFFLEKKAEKIIKKTLRDDNFYSAKFLNKILRLTLKDLEDRENSNKVDIRVANHIKNNFREYRLFHQFNHPTHYILEYICKAILEKISIIPDIPGEIDPLKKAISFPVYPSVYRKLKLKFENPRNYIIRGESFELSEIIKQYITFYSSFSNSELRKIYKKNILLNTPFLRYFLNWFNLMFHQK